MYRMAYKAEQPLITHKVIFYCADDSQEGICFYFPLPLFQKHSFQRSGGLYALIFMLVVLFYLQSFITEKVIDIHP